VTEKDLPHHPCPLQAPLILQVKPFPYQQQQHFQIPQNLVKLLAKEVSMLHSRSILKLLVMLPECPLRAIECNILSFKIPSISSNVIKSCFMTFVKNFLGVQPLKNCNDLLVHRLDQGCGTGWQKVN
jgi:hypothetical protein